MSNDLKPPCFTVMYAGSLPIVGPALAVLFEHTRMGIAQFGYVMGLLRGLIVGLILAATLLVMSEAAIAGVELVRYRIGLYYIEPLKTQMRVEIMEKHDAEVLKELKEKYPTLGGDRDPNGSR